jgi:hypothetical protein
MICAIVFIFMTCSSLIDTYRCFIFWIEVWGSIFHQIVGTYLQRSNIPEDRRVHMPISLTLKVFLYIILSVAASEQSNLKKDTLHPSFQSCTITACTISAFQLLLYATQLRWHMGTCLESHNFQYKYCYCKVTLLLPVP